MPATIEDQLRALMRKLGLVFDCIDLVVDRQENFCFLKINQVGQFLFVEELVPDYPVLRAMTAILASGRTDYDLSVPAVVTMETFMASEAYAALTERVRGKTPDRRLFLTGATWARVAPYVRACPGHERRGGSPQ